MPGGREIKFIIYLAVHEKGFFNKILLGSKAHAQVDFLKKKTIAN